MVMLLLLYTGTYIPFKTAFVEQSPDYVNTIEFSIDSLFFVDIIVNFLSAYENEERNIETRFSKIAWSYIRSWFFIDIVSCIPFQMLDMSGDDNEIQDVSILINPGYENFDATAQDSLSKINPLWFVNGFNGSSSGSLNTKGASYNKLLRLARLPRLYRLLRILRLFKMFRLLKYNRNIKMLLDQIRMNPGYMKMITVSLTVMFLVHLVSCFFYMMASYTDFDPECWVV